LHEHLSAELGLPRPRCFFFFFFFFFFFPTRPQRAHLLVGFASRPLIDKSLKA